MYLASVAKQTDYYPFGVIMDQRSTSTAGYRYGYNGKENDDDVKGEGNSLDYGARIYDPRVGRWLSLDPLMAKYPGMSPYNSTANNPVLYVDQDGHDYAVFVNHKSGQIIIKQTFHVVKNTCDAEVAAAGAGKWNELNGRIEYVVGLPNLGTKECDIVFEITVKERNSEEARDDAYASDKTGRSNLLFTWVPQGLSYGRASRGRNGGISRVGIENTQEEFDRGTAAHEIGHSLVGHGHWRRGLLKQSEDLNPMSPEDKEVTIGNITKILENAGFGSSANVPANDSYHPPLQSTERPKVTLEPSVGREPADFVRGSVQHTQPKI